jgi:hypothetical protein
MKYLVETSGPFMLIDISVEFDIPSDRPAVVQPTGFIMAAAARGQLKILLNDLPDEASDPDFLEFWKADQKIALEAYRSKFGPDAIEDPLDNTVFGTITNGVITLDTPPAPKPAPKPAAKPRSKRG